MTIQLCRVCKSNKLHNFLSLGPTPLANRFLREDQLNDPEPTYPLDVCLCETCKLVQLGYVVPPEVLFKEYIYVSGTSNTLRAHFDQLANAVAKEYHLSSNSLVIDIGSNDGTLLKSFQRMNIKTLGFEPAANIANLARASGVDTINEFFDKKAAEKISTSVKANAILATNVFAHVHDLYSFIEGVQMLLNDDGVFVIEVPYLVDLLDKVLFDTIYHEHLSYFALNPLVTLFSRFDMKVIDVKRIDTHGGSIRVYIAKSSERLSQKETVPTMLKMEKRVGVSSLQTFIEFALQVGMIRDKLTAMLRGFKRSGKRIVAYGAPAKGNTLLNYCGIDADLIDYVVDESPLKQNMYTPGTHIRVLPPRILQDDRPDYALLLAWNYAKEIFDRELIYRENGGRFIVPIPAPRIL